ncbi:hypothetical protein [Deinococcus hopiensis]|uniref:Uncharacterized protein n=1 Tax=Deinococcus hopiensis KR-140 TaxID=695939 RepID=A0A1W1UYF2_9DEIO|nr:hypothetical protein [Deinococcus hopiensis]SMB86117.1 hypothetical protein SAMN00790413_03691 [Deinococcus hopiensis KR-140]
MTQRRWTVFGLLNASWITFGLLTLCMVMGTSRLFFSRGMQAHWLPVSCLISTLVLPGRKAWAFNLSMYALLVAIGIFYATSGTVLMDVKLRYGNEPGGRPRTLAFNCADKGTCRFGRSPALILCTYKNISPVDIVR